VLESSPVKMAQVSDCCLTSLTRQLIRRGLLCCGCCCCCCYSCLNRTIDRNAHSALIFCSAYVEQTSVPAIDAVLLPRSQVWQDWEVAAVLQHAGAGVTAADAVENFAAIHRMERHTTVVPIADSAGETRPDSNELRRSVVWLSRSCSSTCWRPWQTRVYTHRGHSARQDWLQPSWLIGSSQAGCEYQALKVSM
jgi:hypothetical protein